MKLVFVTFFALSFFSQVFAHGMNKPGPNGGYIRMPGAYHVELVPADSETRVYFLDISFKKLPITNTSVAMTLKGIKEQKVICTKDVEFFNCDAKKALLSGYSEIVLESSKGGEKAAVSIYKLPLSY